jgi:2-hydroxy-3-oxopropionate reductase
VEIGFIGLGIMGKPMVTKAALGAGTAATPREIAEQVELVITMLPNSPQVTDVALGTDGLIEAARTGLIFVDMSSIAPLTAREIHDALAAKGVAMLDAPVSGGEPKAIDGTLSVMVGGDLEVFDQVAGVLNAVAASVVHVGPIGGGNTAMLANQVVVALNIAAVAAALVLAQKAGVDSAIVVDAIRGGLAGSALLDAKVPMMLAHDFKPGLRISLHIKDLVNALDTSHEVGAPLPLTASVLEIFTALKADGHEGDDHSGLVQFYESVARTKLDQDQVTI